jgi:hypothetical protein
MGSAIEGKPFGEFENDAPAVGKARGSSRAPRHRQLHGHPIRPPWAVLVDAVPVSAWVTSGDRRRHCRFPLFDPEAVVQGRRPSSLQGFAWSHCTRNAPPAPPTLPPVFRAPAPGALVVHPVPGGSPTRARSTAGPRHARPMSPPGGDAAQGFQRPAGLAAGPRAGARSASARSEPAQRRYGCRFSDCDPARSKAGHQRRGTERPRAAQDSSICHREIHSPERYRPD